MTAPILSDIPAIMTAGDSFAWKKTLSDYPADDGWILTYSLVNASGQIKFNAVANGAAHAVALLIATTAAWDAGVYRYQATVKKADQRKVVDSGTVEILADFETATAGLDARPHCFIMRDSLQALFEGKATSDQLSLSINNRSISLLSPSEVIEWLDYYRAQCVAYDRSERTRQGKPTGQQVKARFVRS